MKEKIRRMAEQVADEQGVELFDVELLGKGKLLVRVYIDREGGVTLDECERFSKSLGVLLDVENPLPGPYTLEVSSPGLDRPLRNPRDFERNIGKLCRIVTREKVENRNFFVGRISSITQEAVRLRMDERDVLIPWAVLSRASLEIEI